MIILKLEIKYLKYNILLIYFNKIIYLSFNIIITLITLAYNAHIYVL